MILCCALRPVSLCPQLRGQGWKKEPACRWLVVCPIPASKMEVTPGPGLEGGAGSKAKLVRGIWLLGLQG